MADVLAHAETNNVINASQKRLLLQEMVLLLVYKGRLPNGKLVAVKRAQQGSTQGGREFKTEIELLSRVHHKNIVSLVGFCFDEGEQMLVYEYIVNGTLKDSLSVRVGTNILT